jgi:SAM-dependent methyltransferase
MYDRCHPAAKEVVSMSLIYRFLYQIGFTPWEQIRDEAAGNQIVALFAREEMHRQPPYGRALEVGCGSGIWSVKLAERGWDVTGVDNVPKALRRARQRADTTGVEPRFVQGDVCKLAKAGIGDGFSLVLDVGCFHELGNSERDAVGREVSSIATPDASVLLMAWERGRRSAMFPHGVSREEVEGAFAGWRVVNDELMDVTGAPSDVQKARPHWYRLKRS